MEHKIGLIGCGTVGQGLLQILHEKKDYLRDVHGFEARVVAISDKLKGTLLAPDGIDIPAVLAMLGAGQGLAAYPHAGRGRTEPLDPLDMLERTDAGIIAEMTYTDIKTGEPATGYIKKALRLGKHVVTSNKGPAALHYRELRDLARQNGVQFRIEGTVMSGTPVFHLAEAGLAGNTITEVQGILNGTTNFILSKMETEGMDYGPALALAQKLGYAEADPTADVEGFDALAKVVILSNVLLGGSLKTSDVARQGISAITKADVEAAKAKGLRYKLIGRAKLEGGAVTASVSPRMLPLADPLAGVMGAQNALSLQTDLMGKITIQGAGAGKIETGFAILSDILAVHRG
ncbi:MAG TPA: homoserine dehydrogenase [Candidatus Aminicenantes bacterium]|nr:homoserine dehydrogenase [Candidatus Aminicenantes bacterium]HRY64026.1 homoserine dehydrogenase [Candidatus Aminicenantes bacterium]HRZ70939.1 homoserine dehydrogenase [Candidatus Aminicenantes bacterium]